MSTTPPTAREIYLDLIDLDASARRRRLEEIRRDDAALADTVQTLLDEQATATVVGAPPSQQGVLAPGTTVGTLRVVSLIGAGGMGEVYIAEDERLDRRVALKAIRGGLRERPRSRARFLREARILSSLEHPGICRIYDYIETGDGDYIVLELIEGASLDRATRGWTTRAKLALAEDLARTLAVAHAAGVVHRDLKPANVMVTPAGEVKVLDFGIARTQSSGDDDEHGAGGALVTRQGAITGTPMYMSPEQASGEAVTSASDMFSFGLLLQELLTGELPREETRDGDTALDLARQGERRPVRGIDADVAALIRRLTSVRPAERPTATETAQRLARIRGKTRRRLIGGAIGVVILVLIAGTIKYTVDLARERSIAVNERREVEQTMSFILEDLKPRLDEVGRLDVLQGAADRVLAYYSKRDLEDLSDRDLLLFARGMQLVAEVQIDQGELEAASAALQREREMLDRLAESSDTDVLFTRSQWHYYVGEIAYRRGDYQTAVAHFTDYRRAAEALVGAEPGNPKWALEVAYATSSRASMYSRLARSDPANRVAHEEAQLRDREASLGMKRMIVAEYADFGPAVLSLANDLSLRSGQRYGACDLQGAIDDASEAVDIVQTYVTLEPDDNDARFRLAMTLHRRARLALEVDEPERALSLCRRMQAETRTLVNIEPDNARWIEERAFGFLREGETLVELGRHDELLTVLQAARTHLHDLEGRGPAERALARRGLAGASLTEARSLLKRGDAAGAIEATRAGLAAIEVEQGPEASVLKAWLSIRQGLAHQDLGRADLAISAFESALRVVGPAPEGLPDVTMVRAAALLSLGRQADAAPHLEWLQACNGVPAWIAALAGDSGS